MVAQTIFGGFSFLAVALCECVTKICLSVSLSPADPQGICNFCRQIVIIAPASYSGMGRRGRANDYFLISDKRVTCFVFSPCNRCKGCSRPCVSSKYNEENLS
uniref:Putative secreted protein n=1 Tax=Anopheles marajoara TaxID=58244 RepID=A0A2M4C937_9DIPT